MNGSGPKPRHFVGVARLQSKVFIHGGFDMTQTVLSDFHVLDMQTSQWSKLRDFGLSRGACGHSLTALPPYQIFLLGGGSITVFPVVDKITINHISDKAMIFNARDSTWVEDQSLPEEFCGKGGGLAGHRAVPVESEGRVSKIICISGRINKSLALASHVIEFDIPN